LRHNFAAEAASSAPRITTTTAPFPFLHSPVGSGYQPPAIEGLSADPFRDTIEDQDSVESSEDEVPASVRFELQPLAPHSSSSPQHQHHARHLSSLEPPMRNRFPSGFSAASPEHLEPGGRFSSRGRGVRQGLRSWARDLSFRPSTLLGGNASPVSSPHNEASQRGFTRIRSWPDVQDLDQFLTSLYRYYTGKGAFCILLSQVINLLYAFCSVIISLNTQNLQSHSLHCRILNLSLLMHRLLGRSFQALALGYFIPELHGKVSNLLTVALK
jgi:autophagy-related protein 9